jgi:hypothetical protein
MNTRLALSYRALAEGFTIDDVLVEILTTVPAPHGAVVWPMPIPTMAQGGQPIPVPSSQPMPVAVAEQAPWQPMPAPPLHVPPTQPAQPAQAVQAAPIQPIEAVQTVPVEAPLPQAMPPIGPPPTIVLPGDPPQAR